MAFTHFSKEFNSKCLNMAHERIRLVRRSSTRQCVLMGLGGVGHERVRATFESINASAKKKAKPKKISRQLCSGVRARGNSQNPFRPTKKEKKVCLFFFFFAFQINFAGQIVLMPSPQLPKSRLCVGACVGSILIYIDICLMHEVNSRGRAHSRSYHNRATTNSCHLHRLKPCYR